jgi:hypothetical protein
MTSRQSQWNVENSRLLSRIFPTFATQRKRTPGIMVAADSWGVGFHRPLSSSFQVCRQSDCQSVLVGEGPGGLLHVYPTDQALGTDRMVSPAEAAEVTARRLTCRRGLCRVLSPTPRTPGLMQAARPQPQPGQGHHLPLEGTRPGLRGPWTLPPLRHPGVVSPDHRGCPREGRGQPTC